MTRRHLTTWYILVHFKEKTFQANDLAVWLGTNVMTKFTKVKTKWTKTLKSKLEDKKCNGPRLTGFCIVMTISLTGNDALLVTIVPADY